MKRNIMVIFTVLQFSLIAPQGASAVELEAGPWQFGINAFLDAEYTWMEKMPMLMKGGMIGTIPETSTFDQTHLNLLVGAEKDRTRININIHSHHAFSAEADNGETRGEFEIEEAYGTYSFSDRLSLQAGFFLTPFGIYNSAKYITSLFATVVLPQMYEMPANYNSSELQEHLEHDLMPPKANFMLTGNFILPAIEAEYFLYATNGFRGTSGRDENTDKGYGGRLRVTAADNYKFGFSYYGANDSESGLSPSEDTGRTKKFGFDVEVLLFSDILKLEYEYVRDNFDNRKHRYSYYVRSTLYIGSFSPFASYDLAKDRGHELYKKTQTRLSIGTGYNWNENINLKAEYHYHFFGDKEKTPVLMNNLENINMLRGAIIFAF